MKNISDPSNFEEPFGVRLEQNGDPVPPEILSINLTKEIYRIIQYYDDPTLEIPKEGSMETLLDLRLPNVAEEDRRAFQDTFYPKPLREAIQAGQDPVRLTYRRIGKDGSWHWMETTVLRQPNPYDDDILLIGVSSSMDDVIRFHQLDLENKRLKEDERIFRMVAQHSDRTLCYYDIAARSSRPWNLANCDTCMLKHLCIHPALLDNPEKNEYILTESVKDMQDMFAEIHAGQLSGQKNLHIKQEDGCLRWFSFKYTCLIHDDAPVKALISFKDITERHEHELSHLRFISSIEEEAEQHLIYLEADLTADLVEKHTDSIRWESDQAEGRSYTWYCDKYFAGFSNQYDLQARQVYSREELIAKYNEGIRETEFVWRVSRNKEEYLWILVRTELVEDPFTGHVKLFSRMTDVTADQEETIALRKRADHDTMTGLLRRGAGEERIKQQLALREEKGGILILLDLDDLKIINDTLGHEHGDHALRSIADTLKGHFRTGDTIARLGGDEFVVFLPGAAQSVEAVAASMTSLLRKLSSISIGENHEQYIHCSAGCAVEMPGEDTFDALYRRADMALYYVKRNGKNNFAFFEPAMLQEDYQFKMNLAAPKIQNSVEGKELKQLLEVVSDYFQGMLSFDLTNNTYRLLEAEHGTDPMPLSGSLDIFWKRMLWRVHPDDREHTLAALSRNRLLVAYENGKTSVGHYFRHQKNAGGNYEGAEMVVTFYVADNGDICAFALLHKMKAL